MDPSLCDAFADILIDEVAKASLFSKVPTIKQARDAFKEAFKDDLSMRKGYVASIAEIILADQLSEAPANLTTLADCNVLADELVKRIFES
jgi:hypothetical protein